MDFLREFSLFLHQRKKYSWMPLLPVMGVFGGPVTLTQGSAVAAFSHTLF
jgi:hypothetical protein